MAQPRCLTVVADPFAAGCHFCLTMPLAELIQGVIFKGGIKQIQHAA
jgi:hypothetical protein